MLLSMTGFGDALQQDDALTVRVEVRSVNNRHLKIVYRLPDGYAGLEPKLDAVVREHLRRGSLQVSLQIERPLGLEDYTVNESLLLHYHQQLSALTSRLHDRGEIRLADLLQLPGVVSDKQMSHVNLAGDWPVIKATLVQALNQLNQMRRQEGATLANDLRSNCQSIAAELDQIELQSPEVVKAYETRLLERINQLLAEHDLSADPSAVIREVGVFADRVDISEEVVRLRSHLNQFEVIMQADQSAGRKLDFLIQELLRETNTIGSKGNDAQIARHVVQIKTHIERLREMIQNVE